MIAAKLTMKRSTISSVVTISLKPKGGIPGDASSAQIDLMADLAEQLSIDELRVTQPQNIVLPHVPNDEL